MKIHILLNKHGKIVGTFRPASGDGVPNVRIVPREGQTLHHFEVPEEFRDVKSGSDFHQAVEILHRSANKA